MIGKGQNWPWPWSGWSRRALVLSTLAVLLATTSIAFFLLGDASLFYWDDYVAPSPSESSTLESSPYDASDLFSTCSPTGDLVSHVIGGVPGYYVFENMWFRNGSYYLFTPTPGRFPPVDAIVNANQMIISNSAIHTPPNLPDTCFEGTTLLSNEGWYTGWHGLWHYYHFAAENILPGFLAASTARRHPWEGAPTRRSTHWQRSREGGIDPPKRMVIPWEADWKDHWGMNQMITDALFPPRLSLPHLPLRDKQGNTADGVGVVDNEAWSELTEGGEKWIYFQHVVICDRWASHRHNPSADQWNKMALPLFQQPHNPDFFQSARHRVLEYHGVSPSRGILNNGERKPKVVYINRQGSSRRLSQVDHEALLDILGTLHRDLGVEVMDAKLEEMGMQDQLKAVGDATIMIGVHGNGLTHSMWMQPGSSLIEIFPKDTFLRDYQSVAEALGHDYWAICNDTVISRDTWMSWGSAQNQGNVHNEKDIPLHAPFLWRLLLQLV